MKRYNNKTQSAKRATAVPTNHPFSPWTATDDGCRYCCSTRVRLQDCLSYCHL